MRWTVHEYQTFKINELNNTAKILLPNRKLKIAFHLLHRFANLSSWNFYAEAQC